MTRAWSIPFPFFSSLPLLLNFHHHKTDSSTVVMKTIQLCSLRATEVMIHYRLLCCLLVALLHMLSVRSALQFCRFFWKKNFGFLTCKNEITLQLCPDLFRVEMWTSKGVAHKLRGKTVGEVQSENIKANFEITKADSVKSNRTAWTSYSWAQIAIWG